ncbi:MAG: LysR family transcriptional regulator [Pseudomonadota bacterium]
MSQTPARRTVARPSTMGIELIELETFIAVAQAGSFSAAAQLLHVTQPTVTGRIQRLESTLGAQLLRRTTRKVDLTPEGQALLAEASAALEGLARLVEGFRDKSRQARQKVVVAATPTLAALTLPIVMQGYSERYPDVQLELRDLHYADVLAAIDDGSANLGVLAYEGSDARYRFEALWSDDMLLMAPRSHALAQLHKVVPADFARHALVLVDQHQGLRSRIAAELQRHGLEMPPCRVVGNLNTLFGMLNAGLGVTLLPRSMARRPEVASNVLVEIDGIDLRRSFGILLSKRASLNAAEQSFCRYLRQLAPSLLAEALQ